MIAGMMKSYPGLTPEMILYDITYQNIALYNAVIPPIKTTPKKSGPESKYNASKDASNPDNFKDEPETFIVRK